MRNPSIDLLPLMLFSVAGGPALVPGVRARGRVHDGQVTGLSLG